MTTDASAVKNEVKESLKKGLVEVTFTKKDGTNRVMVCTLNEDLLPPAQPADPSAEKTVRAANENVQVVYDVEKDGWRSFRWDTFQAYRTT